MPTTNVTQIVMEADSARTRRNDPANSHTAADRSARNMHQIKLSILQLINQESMLSGEELNDLYSLRTPRNDWPAAKFDTPRKRAGELFLDGYLMDTSTPDDNCRTYCLTEKGLEAIA